MSEETQDEISQEEYDALMSQGYGGNTADPKQSVHSFLHDVATADDTTKVGNLNIDELGLPQLPLRTNKELELFCRDIADMPLLADYFGNQAEIATSTSLSKEAKLIELAVVTRKEVADVTKPRKHNKGWFKKKGETSSEQP